MSDRADRERLGNYLLEKHLGDRNYNARDVVLQRAASIRVLGPGVDGAEAPGLADARVLAKLNHPNIASMLQVGTARTQWYVAWERTKATLATELKQAGRTGRIQPERAIRITLGVTSALTSIHAAGIVHGDIRPGTILLQRNGEPRLTLFALRSVAPPNEAERGVLSTERALYTAPERWSNPEVEAATDIYAVGMLLRRLLIGGTLYDGATPAKLREIHMSGNHKWPTHVSWPQAKVVNSCLDPKPWQRPTARELAARLSRLVGEEPSELHNPRRRATRATPINYSPSDASWAGDTGTLLGKALHGSESLVLFVGRFPQLQARIATRELANPLRRCTVVGRLGVDPDLDVVEALAQKIGRDCVADADRVATLLCQRAESNTRPVIQVYAPAGVSTTQARALCTIANRGTDALRVLVICRPANATLVEGAATGLSSVGRISMPDPNAQELAKRLRERMRQLVGPPMAWTPDALTMATDVCSGQHAQLPPIDQMIQNAARFTELHSLRLITSWAILAAAECQQPIESLAELDPQWQTPPPLWPSQEGLSRLRRTRAAILQCSAPS